MLIQNTSRISYQEEKTNHAAISLCSSKIKYLSFTLF